MDLIETATFVSSVEFDQHAVYEIDIPQMAVTISGAANWDCGVSNDSCYNNAVCDNEMCVNTVCAKVNGACIF